MDTSRNQGGLQPLLSAEQEAKEIVNSAKSAKMARHKQAKEEAEAEVAEYRAQLEREFQRKVAEGTGDSDANVKRLEVEKDSKIHHLKNDFWDYFSGCLGHSIEVSHYGASLSCSMVGLILDTNRLLTRDLLVTTELCNGISCRR